jgi:hypothetical protein
MGAPFLASFARSGDFYLLRFATFDQGLSIPDKTGTITRKRFG